MADLTPAEAIEALKRYPNQGDVEFARANDYSYGQPWADFFNRKAFNLLDDPRRAIPLGEPLEAKAVNPEQSKLPFGNIADVYAKGALASKRSALAALGFDPSVMVHDVTRDPKKSTVVGSYTPSTDQIYSNARVPGNTIHESIHRGLDQLKASPFWDKKFDSYHGVLNEYLVRWLMQTKMGDPEKNTGEAGLEERAHAKRMFEAVPSMQRDIDRIESAAAKYLAAKTPRGPR